MSRTPARSSSTGRLVLSRIRALGFTRHWHVIQWIDQQRQPAIRAGSREEAEQMLRAQQTPRAQSPYVFVNAQKGYRPKRHGHPLGGRGIYHLVQRVVQPIIGRPVNPHMLRHSFATRLRTNGCDLQIVQEAMGHVSIQTTTMYAHLATPKRLAELTRFLE